MDLRPYMENLIGEIMSLKDKVIFVSGGSRGIGLAIAREERVSDGAKLALAAKTADPHPKLQELFILLQKKLLKLEESFTPNL